MRMMRRLATPASENQMALVLAVSLVVMGLMLVALLWQSNVIVYQRDLIRTLWNWKFSG
jgi:hypothetical protein